MIYQKQALFLLIFAILSWVDISAQLILEDVVYLNNGSVIHGKIISNQNDTVKVESCCNNIFAICNSDILKTTKEQKTKKNEFKENFVPENQKGFYSHSTIGMLIGKSESEDAESFSFHTTAGYQFNNFVGLGLGIGIEKLKTEIVPVYLSFKSNFEERANSPFFQCGIGYSFPLSNEKSTDEYNNNSYKYEGGFNIGFDVGILSYKAQNKAFTITAGYRYQRVKETFTGYYWTGNSTQKNTYDFNRVAVKIGFMFM